MSPLSPGHLTQAAAALEPAVQGTIALAKMQGLPRDVMARADALSAEMAALQRDLTSRAFTLKQFFRFEA